MDLPLPDASQDAVISQEALLHVPDVARAFVEAYRVLCPGGRIAFTNWVIHRPLSEAQRQLLWDGMAAATLIGIEAHAGLLRDAGFALENSLYIKLVRALVYFSEETQRHNLLSPERLIKQSNEVYIQAWNHHVHGDHDDTPPELREYK